MNYELLARTPLFRGVAPEQIKDILECLSAEEKIFEKGRPIYHAGDKARCLGVLLSGSANIENDDVWGNRTILDHIDPGQVFAEAYACLHGEPLMVNVTAAADASVLFLDVHRIMSPCSSSCAHHLVLIQNLLSVTAEKNLNLSRRIFHTSSKSVRGRLLSYLSFQAIRQNSYEFAIPFNRQQLADYLGVDRSAMSKELGKMQREGILTTEKSWFSIRRLPESPRAR